MRIVFAFSAYTQTKHVRSLMSSPVADASASVGFVSSQHQRLVKNHNTLAWGKESPRRAAASHMRVTEASGSGGGAIASTSVLEYFLSTSPQQKQRPIGRLLNEMNHDTTARLAVELAEFERQTGVANAVDAEDDDDADSNSASTRPQRRATATGGAAAAASYQQPGNSPRAPLSSSRVTGGRSVMMVAPPPGVGSSSAGAPPLSGAQASGGATERAATPPLQPPQESIPGKRIPVVSSNPITGLFCNIPLHRVFSAYRDQFVIGVRNRRGSQSVIGGGGGSLTIHAQPRKKEPLRLTVEDFVQMLKTLLPDQNPSELISLNYARRMIEPFGTVQPYGGPPRVAFPTVFSYLCKCYGHPAIERNVRFLFRVLDAKGRGYIPYSVITGRVVRAWAENRVIGGAIYAWRAFAAALDAAGDVDVRLLENPAQIARDELRMLAYTTKELTEALSQDLECEITSAPRFPTLPQAAKSDEASSIHSGGGRSHRLI